MRTDSHSFGAFRYFIVPCEQMSLFDTVEEKRATAVNSFFSQLAEMKKRNWEIKGKKHLLVCNTKLSEDIFICKFSKDSLAGTKADVVQFRTADLQSTVFALYSIAPTIPFSL